MSEGDFFNDQAKRATAESVRNAEAHTSAEVVVAVRKRSGSYGVLAYHFGLAVGATVILYLLLVPDEYSVGSIVLDGALGFLLGALLAANFDTLLRALSRQKTLQAHVGTSARAAFYDLGISRTSGRSGVLVYVSLFERQPAVLTDIGIDVPALGPAWATTLGELERAVKRRALPAFGKAVESLGETLGRAHPRRADDVNELPDEVQ